ncbi:hypothetical protein DPEC_G00214870 [Dallia pectoralis]|uniref:Uncharacterized protein n=1 Tax=Dallia pectoralis TaxID=75939 RepID=A0ACC2G2B6_DALPE|nr:hypothetical protein DPEC_G00214870 [Dallia pectoralis]
MHGSINHSFPQTTSALRVQAVWVKPPALEYRARAAVLMKGRQVLSRQKCGTGSYSVNTGAINLCHLAVTVSRAETTAALDPRTSQRDFFAGRVNIHQCDLFPRAVRLTGRTVLFRGGRFQREVKGKTKEHNRQGDHTVLFSLIYLSSFSACDSLAF